MLVREPWNGVELTEDVIKQMVKDFVDETTSMMSGNTIVVRTVFGLCECRIVAVYKEIPVVTSDA